MANDTVARPGTLTAKVTITRAATGKTEEYDLVGHVTAEQARALGLVDTKESQDVRNTLVSGT